LQEQFTFFTNFGVESVELVAPGQSILSFLVEPFVDKSEDVMTWSSEWVASSTLEEWKAGEENEDV